MVLKLLGNIQLHPDTPAGETVARLMASKSCAASRAMKLAVLRYAQIIRETPRPDPAIVHALWYVLTSGGRRVLDAEEYPDMDDVRARVHASSLEEERRTLIIEWLNRASFADFARMIESLEAM
jgi:hypothetical protein